MEESNATSQVSIRLATTHAAFIVNTFSLLLLFEAEHIANDLLAPFACPRRSFRIARLAERRQDDDDDDDDEKVLEQE